MPIMKVPSYLNVYKNKEQASNDTSVTLNYLNTEQHIDTSQSGVPKI